MSAPLAAATWRYVIDLAHEGDPAPLLRLLLHPQETDGQGRPNPESLIDLPADVELRFRIVELLVFGPLRKGWGGADTLADLGTKTGWGKTKRKTSGYELGAAEFAVLLGADPQEVAASLGIDPETLRKNLAKRRKARG